MPGTNPHKQHYRANRAPIWVSLQLSRFTSVPRRADGCAGKAAWLERLSEQPTVSLCRVGTRCRSLIVRGLSLGALGSFLWPYPGLGAQLPQQTPLFA